jgi:hypothetical protein
VERDAEARVSFRGDDRLCGERRDECGGVRGADADERAAWRRCHVRPELVEPGDEPFDEAADVLLDGGYARRFDQPHSRDAGVDVRHRRRARVEAAGAPVRPVALDLHVEDVLVREPAGLDRDELLNEPGPKRHEREPRRGEQVLDGAADDDVACLRGVDRNRADPLIAVDEHQRPVLPGDPVDRLDVVHCAGPIGDEGRGDEGGALVDRGCVRLRIRLDLDDLGAAQLLRMRDLPDRREFVLRDDDPVAGAAELKRGDEPADRGGDGGLNRDVVGRRAEQPGECCPRRLRPLDPMVPLGAVLVPTVEVLLVGGPHSVGKGPL